MKIKQIAILGSTGSIGRSTLEIIKSDKTFKVFLIVADKNFRTICFQIKFFQPRIVIINNYSVFFKIKKKFKNTKIKFFNNYNYIKNLKKKINVTVSAIPGIAGLEPTLLFIKISNKVLLANKEAIICGWKLIKKESIKHNSELIPIDSEHFSIGQLIKHYPINQIEKIFITASGGPFLKRSLNKFSQIKPAEAIKHPKWKMGKKISIDSATLVNKVLEISEALKIFPFSLNIYKIIIHPESLVHAIIQLKNGFKLLLYHAPDMKIPISNALNSSYMFLKKKKILRNDFFKLQNLNFHEVDHERFPVVNLIPKINSYNSSLIVFNAANEIFVDQFLKKNIDFTDISRYLKLLLKHKKYIKLAKMNTVNLSDIQKIDLVSRKIAMEIIQERK
jgi:1-deoxy-D-xylulose-5-phosphate reductoisomerase